MKSGQNSANIVDLLEIFGILRKHFKLIVITTVITILASALVTFFVMTPKYEASTEILVNRKLSGDMQDAQFQQVQADVQMISTYKDIITSPTVLNPVDQKLNGYPGYPGGVEQLQKSISISNQQNSQVFTLTAKSSNPNTAATIANTTAQVFKTKISKIMSIDNVSVVSVATPESKPVSPKKLLNLLLGLVLGLVLGIIVAFIREMTDKTVTSSDFLANDLGLTNLGQVDEINDKLFKAKGIQSVSRDTDSAVLIKHRRV